MTPSPEPASVRVRRVGRAAAAAGTALTVGTMWLASRGVAPFGVWCYHFAWLGTLTALAGGLAWRTGRRPMAVAVALSLFFWSAPFWYLFEAVNLRLANWYYVFVPAERPLRWAGMWLAFTTVLPALDLAYRWVRELSRPRAERRRLFRVGPVHRRLAGAAGVAFLALALWRPETFYALVWGAVTLLLEPWNHRRDPETSLLEDVARGRGDRIGALLVGGLCIGGLWELFNAFATARWIYTVPGLEGVKLFEMPLPGFLGFPVLALDGYVAYRALEHLGVAARGWGAATSREAEPPSPRRTAAAAAVALLLCGTIQAGVDHWTVDSVWPALEDVPGVDAPAARRLRAAGVRDLGELAALDSTALVAAGLQRASAGEVARGADLARLRGLGATNASILWAAGIRSVCGLSRTSAGRVARAVADARAAPRAGSPARVRVWLRAAGERCGGEGRRGKLPGGEGRAGVAPERAPRW